MMQQVAVNLVAVVVAAVASIVIGFIWFGPLFGKKWMELSGHKMSDKESMKNMMGPMMVGQLIASLVTAYVLANVIKFSGSSTPVEGAIAGFMVWLGFVATVTLGMVLWDGKPLKLYLLVNGCHLVTYAVMGAILVAMG